MHRRAPVLLGLTAALVLTGGAVSAADLRADERDERRRVEAARAAEVARVAYVQQLQVPVRAVYDQVQPLFDVFDNEDVEEFPIESFPAVRDDVLVGSGAAESLTALGDELAALAVPPAQQPQAAALTEALSQLVGAAGELAEATRGEADDDGRIAEFGTARLSLQRANSSWSVAVVDVLGRGTLHARQRRGTATPSLPEPVSTGDYLRRVGLVCARALDDYTRMFAEDDDEELTALLGATNAESRFEVQEDNKILAVPRPALIGEGSLPPALAAHIDAFEQLVAASAADGRGELARADAVIAVLDASESAVSGAGQAFTAVGSLTCAAWLDPEGTSAARPAPDPSEDSVPA